MNTNKLRQGMTLSMSRRALLQAGAGFAGGALLQAPMVMPVYAEEHASIGTYPAGSSGTSVFIGIAVPRPGTYAVQGEDEWDETVAFTAAETKPIESPIDAVGPMGSTLDDYPNGLGVQPETVGSTRS